MIESKNYSRIAELERLLHFWQTMGILSMTAKSWSLACLSNTITIINQWAISLKHEYDAAFRSASEKIRIIIFQTLQRLASNCIQATPALEGARALSREARRADSRRAQKKTVCVDQSWP